MYSIYPIVYFTPEKLDRLQIKNDLERLGKGIKSRMYFKDNPTPAFS